MPRFTPSRVPLLDQRWTVVPPAAASMPLVDAGAVFPAGSQAGVRWGHVGAGLRVLAVVLRRLQPPAERRAIWRPAPAPPARRRDARSIRRFGPTAATRRCRRRWFTIKGEAAYFTSSTAGADRRVRAVRHPARAADRRVGDRRRLRRRSGDRRSAAALDVRARSRHGALDRRRARRTRSTRIAASRSRRAVRQNGDGVYAKGEYSQARGQHWRATVTGVAHRRRQPTTSSASTIATLTSRSRFDIVSDRSVFDAASPPRAQSRPDDRARATTPICSSRAGAAARADRRRRRRAAAPRAISTRALTAHARGSTTVLVTHGHRDHAARRAGDRRRASRAPRSASCPWPDEDARYDVPWRAARRRRRRSRRRRRADGAAHAGALAGSRGVLARAERDDLHRRSRRRRAAA